MVPTKSQIYLNDFGMNLKAIEIICFVVAVTPTYIKYGCMKTYMPKKTNAVLG